MPAMPSANARPLEQKRILFIYNTADYLLRFRKELILGFQERGFATYAVVPRDDKKIAELESIGVRCICVRMAAQKISPILDLRFIYQLATVFRRLRPDAVFLFTIKPVTYGSIAAHLAGVPHIFAMIVGLGTIFQNPTTLFAPLKRRAATALYKLALRQNDVVFFQNRDDLALFTLDESITFCSQSVLTSGSGVDLTKFTQPATRDWTRPVVVMVARLLREKGVMQYLAAAEEVKATMPNVTFLLIGGVDSGPLSLTSAELRKIQSSIAVEYLGEVDNVDQYLASATLFALPSYYREGVPRSAIEALASGLPIVTTDSVGCRETVIAGKNGILVAPRDHLSLALAILKIVGSPQLAEQMGQASRQYAEERFSVHLVSSIFFTAIEPHIASATGQKPRLLYVVTNADLAGAPIHVSQLIESFKSKFDLLVIAGEDGALLSMLRAAGVATAVIQTIRSNVSPIQDIRSLFSLILWCRRFRPQLIHAHSSKAGLIARLAGGILGIPCIFTVHGWGFTPDNPSRVRHILLWLEKLTSSLVSRYLCVSQADARLAVDLARISTDKVVCIQNGIPDSHVRSNQTVGRPRAIMVARHSAQKDFPTFARTIRRLTVEATITLVGHGTDTAEFKAMFPSDFDLANLTIETLGTRKDVPSLLSESSIFVLLTNYEGLPLSILEAMRAGLPIVATDVGGVGELVIDGVNGFLVPKGDDKAAARALTQLLQSAELRRSMGSASRLRYEEYFRIEKMVAAVRDNYAMVVPSFADHRPEPQTQP